MEKNGGIGIPVNPQTFHSSSVGVVGVEDASSVNGSHHHHRSYSAGASNNNNNNLGTTVNYPANRPYAPLFSSSIFTSFSSRNGMATSSPIMISNNNNKQGHSQHAYQQQYQQGVAPSSILPAAPYSSSAPTTSWMGLKRTYSSEDTTNNNSGEFFSVSPGNSGNRLVFRRGTPTQITPSLSHYDYRQFPSDRNDVDSDDNSDEADGNDYALEQLLSGSQSPAVGAKAPLLLSQSQHSYNMDDLPTRSRSASVPVSVTGSGNHTPPPPPSSTKSNSVEASPPKNSGYSTRNLERRRAASMTSSKANDDSSNTTTATNNNSSSNSEIKESPETSLDSDEDAEYRHNPDVKPPFSYASLIAQAISSCPDRKMTLSNIYNWIQTSYPYYYSRENGWQNSIRHNLSLNKCFVKIPRLEHEPGKGAFWGIDSQYIGNLENGIFKRRRGGGASSASGGASAGSGNGSNSVSPSKAPKDAAAGSNVENAGRGGSLPSSKSLTDLKSASSGGGSGDGSLAANSPQPTSGAAAADKSQANKRRRTTPVGTATLSRRMSLASATAALSVRSQSSDGINFEDWEGPSTLDEEEDDLDGSPRSSSSLSSINSVASASAATRKSIAQSSSTSSPVPQPTSSTSASIASFSRVRSVSFNTTTTLPGNELDYHRHLEMKMAGEHAFSNNKKNNVPEPSFVRNGTARRSTTYSGVDASFNKYPHFNNEKISHHLDGNLDWSGNHHSEELFFVNVNESADITTADSALDSLLNTTSSNLRDDWTTTTVTAK